MSDYLAVGAVSAVLRSILSAAVTNGGPSGLLAGPRPISATAPDLIITGPDEQPRLNLFMYYASLNPALRNLGLPSMNSQGAQLSNPPLALNLHYLLSAYGASQFDPEILLAWAMEVLHDTPVISSQTIQDTLTGLLSLPSPTPEEQLLAASTLATQIEHIRVTPEALTTEEIYRLWSAFQTNYRPTTSYQVSVVVIQRTSAFTSNLPVQRRTVTVVPAQPPIITSVAPATIAAGGVLTIDGRNFVGDANTTTLVAFDSDAGVAPDSLQGSSLAVTLPSDLQAGTRAVRVQRTITYPASPTPHAGFSSAAALFKLVPTIQNASPLAAQQGHTLSIQLSPAVGSSQQAKLYVGDAAIPIDSRPVGQAPATTLDFPIPSDFPLGTFPLYVEIDGAQSPLAPGASGFTPQVTVSA